MRKRFSEEQIVAILREAETGISKQDLYRKHNITEQTYYRWKNKYQETNVTKVRKLRELEKENTNLRKLVSEYAMANQALREHIQKKRWD